MQPRAAHRSRENSYLVASRGECCDNDDRFVATHRSHALGNICLYGSVSGSRVPLVVRERAVAWSRFATGAVTMMTRHPRALRSHTSEFNAEDIIWERSGSRGVCLVVREGATCLDALRAVRCDNDDATFDNFRSYILGGRVAVIGEAEVAACRCRSRDHG